jgi:small subunit ribosomal protein S17
MVRKKKEDEVDETIAAGDEGAVEETAVEAAADDAAPIEEAPVEAAAAEAEPAVEEKPKKKAAPKTAKTETQTAASGTGEDKKVHKRAEKVGIVSSDKMMKTVTVRVDRLVKHPVYRKYVKKRKKFMAHDEMGAKVGDKVKIVETRPLSARKRWRVVEIIQKAEL